MALVPAVHVKTIFHLLPVLNYTHQGMWNPNLDQETFQYSVFKKEKRKHFLWLWIEWSVIPSAPRSSFIVWHPWRQKMVMGLLVLAPSAISWRTVLCCAIIAVFFISNDSDKKCLCPQTKLSESGLLACYLTSDKVHTCGTAMNVCAKDFRSKILRLSILLYCLKLYII